MGFVAQGSEGLLGPSLVKASQCTEWGQRKARRWPLEPFQSNICTRAHRYSIGQGPSSPGALVYQEH